MGNGHWELGNWKREIGNGEWKMENEKWKMIPAAEYRQKTGRQNMRFGTLEIMAAGLRVTYTDEQGVDKGFSHFAFALKD